MNFNYNEIEKHISTARLSSYRSLTPSATLEEVVGLYYWNKALCSAFYPALQCLEVTFRNAIHSAASAHFNNGAWYDPLVRRVGDELYARRQLRLDPVTGRREKSISEKNLKTAKDKLSSANKAVTPPGVVAELNFGFWVSLLTGQYVDINNRTKLWPNLTLNVFPNTYGPERNMPFLFQKFDRIRDIRNRLSHHEPLWKDRSSTNLASGLSYVKSMYDDITVCIGYMSRDRKLFLEESSIGKEFIRLSSRKGIDEFTNWNNLGHICPRTLAKDLNMYLNMCDKNKTVYISRKKSMYKLTKC